MKPTGTYVHKYLGKVQITEDCIASTPRMIYVTCDKELYLLHEQDLI